MLYRTLIMVPVWSLCLVTYAQIRVDVPVRTTGPDSSRVLLGVGTPEQLDAGLSVEAATIGMAHWAIATMDGDTVVLVPDPPETTVRTGLLIRGLMPGQATGAIHIRIHDHPVLPLLHSDGMAATAMDLPEGRVFETITVDGACILQGTGIMSCPPNTVRMNASTCVDVNSTSGFTFYQAAAHCAKRGGKLCSWDDHAAACLRIGSGLTGLFDDWEWINDTSNHTHTVDQAGRTTCLSQRSAGPNLTGGTRCCYRAR
jgi:hypothetical protein